MSFFGFVGLRGRCDEFELCLHPSHCIARACVWGIRACGTYCGSRCARVGYLFHPDHPYVSDLREFTERAPSPRAGCRGCLTYQQQHTYPCRVIIPSRWPLFRSSGCPETMSSIFRVRFLVIDHRDDSFFVLMHSDDDENTDLFCFSQTANTYDDHWQLTRCNQS